MKYLLLIVYAAAEAWTQTDAIRIPDSNGGAVEVSAAGEENFVLESVDDGLSWRNLRIPGTGDLFYFASSGDGATLYAARSLPPFGHSKSADGGNSWEALATIEFQNRVAIDPRDSNHLFAYYNHGVQESLDAGKTWRNITGNLPWTRIGLSLGPWIHFLSPDGNSDAGPVVRTWAGWFARTDTQQWRLFPGTENREAPAAFAILSGNRFLARYGEELWIYDHYFEDLRRIPSPQAFTRFATDPAFPNRVYGLAGQSHFLSEDSGRTWTPSSTPVPELTTWIGDKPVSSLSRHGGKWFASGPQSTDLRISRTDSAGQLVFDWIYPLPGVQSPVTPAVAANGEIYIAGRTSGPVPSDFIWRLSPAGDYISGYQFEPLGDFREVRLEPNGDVLLTGAGKEIRFDRELSRLLP